MRLAFPILLLSATAALAQPAPDKPFVYDSATPILKGFTPPTPVTIAPAQEEAATPQSVGSDSKPADKPPNIELRRTMPDLQQPQPAKPPAKSVV